MRSEYYRFGFLLNPLNTRPGEPRLHICLDRWGMVGNEDKTPLLSLDLQTDDEVDEAIDELIKDLEFVRDKAKAGLLRTKKAA